jgi:hypothetical protein
MTDLDREQLKRQCADALEASTESSGWTAFMCWRTRSGRSGRSTAPMAS